MHKSVGIHNTTSPILATTFGGGDIPPYQRQTLEQIAPLRCLEDRVNLFLEVQPNALGVLPCATSLNHNQCLDEALTNAILLCPTGMRVFFSLQQSLHEWLASLL